jgi:hypothetical protein
MKLAEVTEASDRQIQELTAQLDRKEFQMQRQELKVNSYEKYLQRRALADSDAA